METEKITINLGMVELGKIDLLVENGVFSNRSDFIRSAIRGQLERYADDIKGYMQPNDMEKAVDEVKGYNYVFSMGVYRLTYGTLLALREKKKKLCIKIIGMLVIEDVITGKLFQETVERIRVYGKYMASNEVKQIIEDMEAQKK